jgi:hypothetical protein
MSKEIEITEVALMKRPVLSAGTRKSLCVQLGDSAGKELCDYLDYLVDRVERLERSKVDVTPIVDIGPSRSESARIRKAA